MSKNNFMEKHNILLIDDEDMTHVILKALLKSKYNLIIAKNAQEGIDLLSEQPVNLILLDVQMPKVSGIELLESLMIDSVLRSIPIIIITGKATKEIEKKARELGAVDFINKQLLFKQKETALNLIKESISHDVHSPQHYLDIHRDLKPIFISLFKQIKAGSLKSGCREIAAGLMKIFDINYVSFWTSHTAKPKLIISMGKEKPEHFGTDENLSGYEFLEHFSSKKPYMINNLPSLNKNFFGDHSKELGLSSEIGIPLFKISKEVLFFHKLRVPDTVPTFGFVIIKRNRVFTTNEFNKLYQFLIICGTYLWGLYENENIMGEHL